MGKRKRIPYSQEEMAWLEENRMMVLGPYHRAFVEKFDRPDVTYDHIKSLRTRKGWKVGRDGSRYKGLNRKYSDEALAFLKEHETMPRTEQHRLFQERFNRPDLNFKAFAALCKRMGMRTGRTGHFTKGMTPANKGKKMPFNENSARTRFKKGQRTGRANAIYKPIGTERVSKDGYLERKVHDGMPFQSRWRSVHLIQWEAVNGPVPKGYALKCLDGDRSNTDPSNWSCIPRAMLPRLNGKSGRDYDHAPDELKPTIMAIAKLEHKAKQRR